MASDEKCRSLKRKLETERMHKRRYKTLASNSDVLRWCMLCEEFWKLESCCDCEESRELEGYPTKCGLLVCGFCAENKKQKDLAMNLTNFIPCSNCCERLDITLPVSFEPKPAKR